MALLWLDGFDTYGDAGNTQPQPTTVLEKAYGYAHDDTQFDNELNDGPIGSVGNVLENTPSAYTAILATPDLTTNETMIAGIWFRRYREDFASGDHDWPLLVFKNGTDCEVRLCMGKDSFFVTGVNEKFLGGTGVKTPLLQWHHIEMKVLARTDNTGTVNVRINNCPVLDISGVQTANTANYFTKCSIGDIHAAGVSASTRFDSFYLCDGSGNTCNDFLGNAYVHTIFPDGDDSVNFATTGNTANHFENVGYMDAMWALDYIEDSTTGNRDIFTADATLNFATVHALQVSCLAAAVTSNQSYSIVVDSNGTETESANIAVTTTTCSTGRFAVELDPDTSNAWTPATINAVKFGIELK